MRSGSVEFHVNHATGNGNYLIPLSISQARALTPELVLSYSTQGGQSLFGFGCDLPIAKITRSTLRGVPRYNDTLQDAEVVKDIFTLSGEELVEVNTEKSTDNLWNITYYQPRLLDKVSRIEYWRGTQSSIKNFWLVREPNGVNHLFGQSESAKIVDLDDANRTFTWLLEKSSDAKGNEVLYSYEHDKGNSNRYLKSIRYGNYEAPELSTEEKTLDKTEKKIAYQYAFEIIFDYGEYTLENLKKGLIQPTSNPETRLDSFISYRAGFAIKTERLCKNIFLFHHFTEEFNNTPVLVKRWELNYHTEETTCLTFLQSVQEHGYRTLQSGNVLTRVKPKIELQYTEFNLAKQFSDNTLQFSDSGPVPTNGIQYQFIDLYREGLPGILSTQNSATFYRRNYGNGTFSEPFLLPQFPIEGNASFLRHPFMDIPGTDQLAFVVSEGNVGGFYETLEEVQWNDNSLSDNNAPAHLQWKNFQPFEKYPSDFIDPRTELLDLNASGMSDVVNLGAAEPFFYPSLGKKGFGSVQLLKFPADFPTQNIDRYQLVTFANILGDGLMHRVKIDDETIDYWPNLGHGKFGAKISLPSPFKSFPKNEFDAARLLLANVKGTGGIDLLYIYPDRIDIYINQQGKAFVKHPTAITFPADNSYTIDDSIQIADVFGKGCATLVFGKPGLTWQHYYYDFAPEQKPHLLQKISNNCGASTEITYSSSTQTYLEDNSRQRQLACRCAVPITVVDKVITKEQISQLTLVKRYKFHDGYYDPFERDFLGFGFVEHWDADDSTSQTKEGDSSVAYTKEWYANKLLVENSETDKSTLQLVYAYSNNVFYLRTPDTSFPTGLITLKTADLKEYDKQLEDPQTASFFLRQVNVALKGKLLRREVYGLTGDRLQDNAYHVTENGFTIDYKKFPTDTLYGIFTVQPRESLTFDYERNPADPQLTHLFYLEWDEYNNLLKSAEVHYPRKLQKQVINLPENKELASRKGEKNWVDEVNAAYQIASQNNSYLDQSSLRIIGTVNNYCEAKQGGEFFFVGYPLEVKMFDLSAKNDSSSIIYSVTQVKTIFDNNIKADETLLHRQKYYYHEAIIQLPLLKYTETFVENKDVFYKLFAMYQQGLEENKDNLTEIEKNNFDEKLKQAGYVLRDNNSWWKPSLVMNYVSSFYQLTALTSFTDEQTDPFHFSKAEIIYDRYQLFPIKQIHYLYDPDKKALQPIPQVILQMDYQALAPHTSTDPNGVTDQVLFDSLGVAVAHSRYGKVNNQSMGNMPLNEELLEELNQSLSLDKILAEPNRYVAQASQIFFYNDEETPNWCLHISRDQFQNTLPLLDNNNLPKPCFPLLLAYQDGLGDIIQSKAYKDDKLWTVSGYIHYNNKGLAVNHYLPCDSDNYQYENKETFLKKISVPPTRTEYDALNRPIKIVNPQGLYKYRIIAPWYKIDFDENDTAVNSPHYLTPEISLFDVQGNAFLQMEITKYQAKEKNEFKVLLTRTTFDVLRRPISLQDPRLNHPNMIYHYNKLGQIILQQSVDSGAKFNLFNAYGKLWQQSDSCNQTLIFDYDNWQRLVSKHIQSPDNSLHLYEKIEYGDLQAEAAVRNLYGEIVKCYDQAGILYFNCYDIQGNPLEIRRQLNKIAGKNREDLSKAINWDEIDNEDKSTELIFQAWYDVFNRVIQQQWRLGADSAAPSIISKSYNLLGHLKSVALKKGGQANSNIVEGIQYNSLGQRTAIIYGNQVTSAYTYEEKTPRLSKFATTHAKSNRTFLAIDYQYDGFGNIVNIDDKTYENLIKIEVDKSLSSSTSKAEPSTVQPHFYDYDSLYRLRSATGEELTKKELKPEGGSTATILNLLQAQQHKQYEETYDYEDGGNVVNRKHLSTDEKEQVSYITNQVSNRLEQSSTASEQKLSYTHDAVGNLSKIENNTEEKAQNLMTWNALNQLTSVKTKELEEYYSYDIHGRRVRKLSIHQDGTMTEKLYYRSYEITRKWQSSASATFTLQKNATQTALRIHDNRGCVASYYTKFSESGLEKNKIVYHHHDHLGSVVLELSSDADNPEVLTYEEYLPYGDTAFIAAQDEENFNTKTYHYSGKECDATGMYYYGARYYDPKLERWISTDPAGFVDGLNVYGFVKSNPITYRDIKGMSGTIGNPILLNSPPPSPILADLSNSDDDSVNSGSLTTSTTTISDDEEGLRSVIGDESEAFKFSEVVEKITSNTRLQEENSSYLISSIKYGEKTLAEFKIPAKFPDSLKAYCVNPYAYHPRAIHKHGFLSYDELGKELDKYSAEVQTSKGKETVSTIIVKAVMRVMKEKNEGLNDLLGILKKHEGALELFGQLVGAAAVETGRGYLKSHKNFEGREVFDKDARVVVWKGNTGFLDSYAAFHRIERGVKISDVLTHQEEKKATKLALAGKGSQKCIEASSGVKIDFYQESRKFYDSSYKFALTSQIIYMKNYMQEQFSRCEKRSDGKMRAFTNYGFSQQLIPDYTRQNTLTHNNAIVGPATSTTTTTTTTSTTTTPNTTTTTTTSAPSFLNKADDKKRQTDNNNANFEPSSFTKKRKFD